MQQGSSRSVNIKTLKFEDVAVIILNHFFISAHLFFIDPGANSKQICAMNV